MSHTSNLKTNPDACPLAKKCGGCQLQNMTYDRQLKWKQARCEILLKKFGKVSTISGILNSCTYVGSAASTYGIALISEKAGWNFTLLIWFIIALTGTVICFVAARPWTKKMGE